MGSQKIAWLGCLLSLGGCANGAARELGGRDVDPILGANATGGTNSTDTGTGTAGANTGDDLPDQDGGDSGGSTGPDAASNANGEPDSSFPPPPPSGVIITEVMARPDMGSSNEWIELFNGGDQSLELQDCELFDGETLRSGATIDAALSIAPGAYLLLGRDHVEAESGVKPDYVYSGVYLSPDETVTLKCNGQIVTQIRYENAESATSLQLDARYVAAGRTDVLSAWCNGTAALKAGANLGTPKAANHDCPGVAAP